MPNNRDNFNQSTIKKVASRVGYRCSFPGCNSATIGASMESEDKISITGVAAHICAAAPGGCRYDANMTVDERKSESNCIWLCQTHSKLIDTDEKTYTVDVLKKYKHDAEIASSQALANPNYFENYYSSNQEDLTLIEELINGLIIDGDFEKVKVLLNQYKSDFGDFYSELIMRYNIIYDVYCNHSKLQSDIKLYKKSPVKSGINQIIELLITFLMKDEVNELIEFCNDEELVKFGEMLLNDELSSKIFKIADSDDKFIIKKEYQNMFKKIISNYVFTQCNFGITTENGKYVELYNDEFFYEIQYLIFKLCRSSILNLEIDESDIRIITSLMYKLLHLDTDFQINFFEKYLNFLIVRPETFERTYSQIADSIKQSNEIKELYFSYLVINHTEELNIEELLTFCTSNSRYISLNLWLSNKSITEQENFLDEHQYLYSKNSYFIYLKYLLLDDKSIITPIVLKYNDAYSDDFLFNCIKYKILNDSDVLEWLIDNITKITPPSIKIYLQILQENHRWKELYDLSNIIFGDNIKYEISVILQNSKDDYYVSKSEELYKECMC